MSWIDGKLLAFDLETTSKDPHEARIVTAATVSINMATGVKYVNEWLSDVDGVEIPAETTEIHGISTEHARENGRPATSVAGEISATLQNAWRQMIPVVGHNLAYDFTVLDAEMLRHCPERTLDFGPVLDTFVLDKHFSWRKGSRKLVDTARFYGVTLSEEDAHGATADALASARILWKMAKAYPTLRERRLPELFALQIEWHAEQAASLAQYFDDKGISHDVSLEWPLRTAVTA